jgi:hypothetical protein
VVPVRGDETDYPPVMGASVFSGAVTVIHILIADLTYGLVDPRAESGSTRETFWRGRSPPDAVSQSTTDPRRGQ